MGRLNSESLRGRLPFAVFFGIVYTYLWLWVDPSLLYHGSEAPTFPAFSTSSAFLKSFLVLPGGPVEYLAALLSQAYYYPWSGALAVTAIAGLLGWALSDLVGALAGQRVAFIWGVPALVILSLSTQYVHGLALLTSVLAAACAACTYVRMLRLSPAARLVAFLACSGPLYYVAGKGYILYALLCGIVELGAKRGRLLIPCYAVFAWALPYLLGPYCLELSATGLHTRLTSIPVHGSAPGENATTGLCVFLLVAATIAVFRRKIAGALPQPGPSAPPSATDADESRQDGTSRDEDPAGSGEATHRRGLWDSLHDLKAKPALELLVVLVAAIVVVALSFDGDRARLRRISRAANKHQWKDVLWEARSVGCEEPSFQAAHATTRALFEVGRLPYEMFTFPQHPGGFLLAWGTRSRRQAAIRERFVPAEAAGAPMGNLTTEEWFFKRQSCFNTIGDLPLQLGLVNESEHEAYEALEVFGEHPTILARLAISLLAKDQPEAARRHLEALRTYVHYGDFARKMLQALELDPSLSSDPYLNYLRSVRLDQEATITGIYLEDRLESLLRRNRRNRMAFEYRMAFFLLNLLLEDFVENLNGLNAFDYAEIPRHYEEAILIHEGLSGKRVDLHGRQISPQTRHAYQTLTQMLPGLRRPGSRLTTREAITSDFGHTYFFYYIVYRGQL